MSSINQQNVGPWTPAKVDATKKEVLRRAAEDPAFRKRCLESARAVIKEVSGVELPQGAPPMRFVERLDEIVILLPPLARAGGELSDEDLQLVTGGKASKAENSSKWVESIYGGVMSGIGGSG